MVEIKTLAPTIIDTVKAVEQGCRKVQEDDQFICDMSTWITIDEQYCQGCLATTTLMHLSNKTATDMLNSFTKTKHFAFPGQTDRSHAYGIVLDNDNIDLCDFTCFELAINGLRQSDLHPLLEFYDLNVHPNGYEAAEYLFDNFLQGLSEETTKEDLIVYADFLRDDFIPKLQKWFTPAN